MTTNENMKLRGLLMMPPGGDCLHEMIGCTPGAGGPEHQVQRNRDPERIKNIAAG